jgi:hypothetical protein
VVNAVAEKSGSISHLKRKRKKGKENKFRGVHT